MIGSLQVVGAAGVIGLPGMTVRHHDVLDLRWIETGLLDPGDDDVTGFFRVVQRVDQDQALARRDDEGALRRKADVPHVVEDFVGSTV